MWGPCGSSAGPALPSPPGSEVIRMQNVAKFIGYVVDFMKIEFNLFGFDLSFWGIFIFTSLASIVLSAIGDIFND